MGQKASKFDVAEAWLKPHGQHRLQDVDLRKLQKLVKLGRLAPCYAPYEGEDWAAKEVRPGLSLYTRTAAGTNRMC